MHHARGTLLKIKFNKFRAILVVLDFLTTWGIYFLASPYFLQFLATFGATSIFQKSPQSACSKFYIRCHFTRNNYLLADSSEVDFAKIALRPDNSDVHFTVISRYDKEGQRHQVLYEKNFVNILREAEKWPNLESESECEGLNWSSEEEAVVDRKWLSWRKAQRSIHS